MACVVTEVPPLGAEDPAPRRVCVMIEPTPFTYISGYKNRFQAMLRYLVEAGDQVLVVTTGPNCPTEWEGIPVVEAVGHRLPWYPDVPQSFGISPNVMRAVLAFKPDVVHCTSPGAMPLGCFLYCRVLRSVPLLLSYHTHVAKYIPDYCKPAWTVPVWQFLYYLFISSGHRMADVTLTTSQQLAEELEGQNCIWPALRRGPEPTDGARQPEPLGVWRKGVDADLFHPRFKSADMRKLLSEGHPEDPLLLFIGRLGHEKNVFFVRDIMQELKRTGVERVRFAVVGGGPAFEDLRVHFAGMPVHFAGALSGDELSQAYASADIFVMPSESETLGFVVLEAMAAGTPVVAVRAGGIPDIIQKQEVGYLYESQDSKGAAAAIGRLLGDRALHQRVAEAARAEVCKWDWRAATRHLRRQHGDAIELHKLRRQVEVSRRRRAFCLAMALAAICLSISFSDTYISASFRKSI